MKKLKFTIIGIIISISCFSQNDWKYKDMSAGDHLVYSTKLKYNSYIFSAVAVGTGIGAVVSFPNIHRQYRQMFGAMSFACSVYALVLHFQSINHIKMAGIKLNKMQVKPTENGLSLVLKLN